MSVCVILVFIPSTIESYLATIRHLQIIHGLPDPSLASFPCLGYMLRGVRRSLPASTRKQRLPITLTLLRAIRSTSAPTFNKTMLWAAFCLGFFAFMWSGEFTCPSLERFNDDMLSIQDVAVDSHSHTTILTIRLRHSKTDPFGAGVTLYVGRTGDTLCPVSAVLAYLAVRPKTPGPLFIYKDGTPLSRTCLIREPVA